MRADAKLSPRFRREKRGPKSGHTR